MECRFRRDRLLESFTHSLWSDEKGNSSLFSFSFSPFVPSLFPSFLLPFLSSLPPSFFGLVELYPFQSLFGVLWHSTKTDVQHSGGTTREGTMNIPVDIRHGRGTLMSSFILVIRLY